MGTFEISVTVKHLVTKFPFVTSSEQIFGVWVTADDLESAVQQAEEHMDTMVLSRKLDAEDARMEKMDKTTPEKFEERFIKPSADEPQDEKEDLISEEDEAQDEEDEFTLRDEDEPYEPEHEGPA